MTLPLVSAEAPLRVFETLRLLDTLDGGAHVTLPSVFAGPCLYDTLKL